MVVIAERLDGSFPNIKIEHGELRAYLRENSNIAGYLGAKLADTGVVAEVKQEARVVSVRFGGSPPLSIIGEKIKELATINGWQLFSVERKI